MPKKYRMWTIEEVEALKAAHEKHCKARDKWKAIQSDPEFKSILGGRSTTELRNKWYYLTCGNRGRIARLNHGSASNEDGTSQEAEEFSDTGNSDKTDVSSQTEVEDEEEEEQQLSEVEEEEEQLSEDEEDMMVKLVTEFEAKMKEKFAKSLLDVADSVGRASLVVREMHISQKDSGVHVLHLKNLLDKADKQLSQVFNKLGVEKYDHKDPSKPYVPVVLKPGYRLNDRILRPAEVGVIIIED